MLLLIGSGLAATLTVGASGFGSVAAAVAAASSGDTVVVDPGTWAGGVDFGGKSIELRSRDGAESTFLEGGGWVVLQAVAGESGVVVDGFTIRNPGGYGIYVENGATLSLLNSVLSGMGTSSNYGGAFTIGTGFGVVEDCRFEDNDAGWGGHLYLGSGSLTVRRSTLDTGSAVYGGAIYQSSGSLLVEDSSFTGNVASVHSGAIWVGGSAVLDATELTRNSAAGGYDGGAVLLGGGANLVLAGGSFTDNLVTTWETGGHHGGAVAVPSGGTLTVDGTFFDGNQGYYGGAIYAYGATVDLAAANFDGNYAYYGGAILELYSAVTDAGSTYHANTSLYGGGAVYSNGGSVWTSSGSQFSENLAQYSHGGAFVAYYGKFDFTDTLFQENIAYYNGGGLYLTQLYQTASCTGCTFDQNEGVYGSGGGLYAYYEADLVLTDSVYTDNQATGGGGLYAYYGTDITGSGLTFDGNQATSYAGGAVSLTGGSNDTWRITGSTLTDNTAGTDGGGILAAQGVALTLDDVSLLRNSAGDEGFGGGLAAAGTTRVTVTHSTLAGNVARYGGGAYVSDANSGGTWTNDLLVENTAAIGGALCLVDSVRQTVWNNDLLGNAATEGGGALCLTGVQADVRNNLFGWTTAGPAVEIWASESKGEATFGYNAWHENPGGNAAEGSGDPAGAPGSVAGDPRLVAYSRNGVSDDDVYTPWTDSPLLDAGDPEILDPDGGPSDIGVTGGPEADPTDADSDGYPGRVDCDDANASVNPAAFETWYDGVDSDCGGESDYDQDGDGADSADHGGTDCADSDPTVTTCAEDTGSPDTASERDTDTTVGGGCGCATGGPTSAAGIALLSGILGLARRRRAPTGR